VATSFDPIGSSSGLHYEPIVLKHVANLIIIKLVVFDRTCYYYLFYQVPSLVPNRLSQPAQKLRKIFALLLPCHFMFYKYVTQTKVGFYFMVCYHMACENVNASYSHQGSACIYRVVRVMKFIASFMKISCLV
jgi:Na+-transporting NADH:ubiquinone oxidoreductase subunit NqrB